MITIPNLRISYGFTLIEIIIAISIIAILSGVVIPIYVNLVDNAQEAHIDGMEATLHSAIVLWASENFIEKGELLYPNNNMVTIEFMTDPGLMENWTDLGGGVWQYNETGGTLIYNQTENGYGYTVEKTYSNDNL